MSLHDSHRATRRSPASRTKRSASRGYHWRTARQLAPRHLLPWARDDGGNRYLLAPPGGRSESASSERDAVLPVHRAEDDHHLHDLHGRRGDADAGRAKDLGVDSGTSWTEARRQGLASAGSRWAQEHHEG